LQPASLTKLMAMYVISTALKNGTIHLDDKVRISKKAWQTGGSRMFIKVGDDVLVRDLIQGIVVASGNDASVAMAEQTAGSEEAFATLMNTQAKALGMKNSHFVDSNGLPNPDHYSTARDLATLARAIIQDYPDDYKLYSEKWFTFNNIRQPNRNRLLWNFPNADGLKTGHTQDAGFCLVGSANKDGTRLISVIMGAPNDHTRTADSISLLTYGYKFFETHKVYPGSKGITTVRVWRGTDKNLDVGLAKDLYVTLPPGQYKNLKATLNLHEPVSAPVTKGQTLGKLEVLLDGKVLVSEPLVALKDDEKGGFFRNITDSIHWGLNMMFSKNKEVVVVPKG
jgi:D-alanyl-D-alanine carboxypeptidase (penicillin-binding protein 5/6)